MFSGVKATINSYWRIGVVSGLIIFDGLVVCVCIVDAVRFGSDGLSLASASRVAIEGFTEGKSVLSAFGVLAFFVVGLPMALALLSTLVAPHERWPWYLRAQGKGILTTHIVLSGCIALFTLVAFSMEVLSGWTEGETVKYSFISIWLSTVLLLKPVYVLYVSPIIRKFLVRVSAGHKTKFTDVMEEVVTEDGFEAGHK